MDTTGHDPNASFRQMTHIIQLGSVLVLLLHFYYYFLPAMTNWGLRNTITDMILAGSYKMGLFSKVYKSKLIAIGLLALSLFATKGRKEESLSYRGVVILILAGLVIYFLSIFLPYAMLDWDMNTRAITYMIISVAGYMMILTGGLRLSRVIGSSFQKGDILNRDNAGFPQEKRLIKTEYSFNLPAVYTIRGKTEKSWLNFINCRRGFLLIGSSGCGKSTIFIENFIRQFSEKAFSLFVFDFKYPDLTELTYNQFLANRKKYPPNTRFFAVQFDDLSRSHQCNLIHPESMTYIADAIGASNTIFMSINKNSADRKDFFVDSAINFFAAVIWFLKKYKNGVYCSLPHAIELAQVDYSRLFSILRTESSIGALISPFINAFQNGSMEMLDSQIASAAISLAKLSSPELYYVLSGNDFTLDINNPRAPKILCLGSNPQKQEAIAPVLSLFIDRLNKLVNKKGAYKCALICDEFATVRAASMITTLATARSNNIVPVIAIQDFHQLEDYYSHHEAKKIMNMTGNLVCGQIGGDTARMVSERFPKTMQDRRSMSVNSIDTSFNSSQYLETDVSPATIAALSSGEFVGIVADDPDKRIELKAFHARVVKDFKADSRNKRGWHPRPVVRRVDMEMIEANFARIKGEVSEMVDREMDRIMADGKLSRFVVKRE